MPHTEMKRAYLTIFLLLGLAGSAAAQSDELTLRPGQKGSAARGKVSVRFVLLAEDSRCPAGVACIWAGNAKVKVEVTIRRRAKKAFELNTGVEPRSVEFDGYRFKLIDVTPRPGEKATGPHAVPKVRISVTKI